MKLIMFGVDDKEVPYAKEWATKTGNEVKLVREQLTTSTIDLVEGFDGISVLQTSKIDDPAIYTKLKQFGIKQQSTPNKQEHQSASVKVSQLKMVW